MTVTGLVLAAGAGTRLGMPKALVVRDGVPWVARATRLLLAAGCDRVVVVLGASATEALAFVPTDDAISTIINVDWSSGMASSLRAGLEALSGTAAADDAALITLVDTPGLPLDAVRRVLAAGSPLARAVYDGRPGHPVLISSQHWGPISATLAGDHGARAYLEAHAVTDIECGDLWSGRDIDS
ncbi:NTP transferase domain-containing protein [Conyzicola sp.]|uniref:nucleotidyltransferase family protein n=1 Tax=Conyzicola sp. TaxID=1969404 RepID=UPI0039893A1E